MLSLIFELKRQAGSAILVKNPELLQSDMVRSLQNGKKFLPVKNEIQHSSVF